MRLGTGVYGKLLLFPFSFAVNLNILFKKFISLNTLCNIHIDMCSTHTHTQIYMKTDNITCW